jgi:HEAT repeat protein
MCLPRSLKACRCVPAGARPRSCGPVWRSNVADFHALLLSCVAEQGSLAGQRELNGPLPYTPCLGDVVCDDDRMGVVTNDDSDRVLLDTDLCSIWRRLEELLTTWEETLPEAAGPQVTYLRGLLDMARAVSQNTAIPDLAADRVAVLPGLRDRLSGDDLATSVFDAYAEFAGAPRAVPEHVRPSRIPLLVKLDSRKTPGGVLMLQIEAVAQGSGVLYPVPGVPFWLERDFRESAAEALRLAEEVTGHVLADADVDLRYSLTCLYPDRITLPLRGNSAQLGFYLACKDVLSRLAGGHGIQFDSGIAVTGALARPVEGAGPVNVAAVGEINHKCLAARDQGCRGILLPQDNIREAEASLPLTPNKPAIHPCRTVEEAEDLVTGVVPALIQYLNTMIDRLSRIPVYRDGRQLSTEDLYIDPDVLVEKPPEELDRQRAEAAPPWGDHDEELEDRTGFWVEFQRSLHEQPGDLTVLERRRWQSILTGNERRLVLKGAPGSGKTLTTRQWIVEVCGDALRQIEQGTDLRTLPLPLWVTASALAEPASETLCAGDTEKAVVEAVANTVRRRFSPSFEGWLRRRVSSPDTVLVIDALDEVRDTRDRASEERFRDRCKEMATWLTRLLLTCRTMQWESRRSWVPWEERTEIELAPFNAAQQQTFIIRFYRRESGEADALQQRFRQNRAIRHACGSPLLLTYTCLLHGNESSALADDCTIAQLYGAVLRTVLRGETRAVLPPWAPSSSTLARCERALRQIAAALFLRAPEANSFVFDDWDDACEDARLPNDLSPEDFLAKLEDVGLIVTGGQRNDADSWSFAHRTLLEYLTANALARRPQEEWLAEAKKHFWFQPEWHEVLKFLAGSAEDATPLVRAVQSERDDMFGSMVALQADLVGSAKAIDEEVALETASAVWCSLNHPMAWDRFGSWLQAVCQNTLVRSHLPDQYREYTDMPGRGFGGVDDITEALGKLACAEAVPILAEIADDEEQEIANEAVLVLRHFEPTPDVLAIFERTARRRTGYPDLAMRLNAIPELASSGHSGTLELLMDLTRDPYPEIREAAAAAIGSLSLPPCLARLELLAQDPDIAVRIGAVKGLARTGLPETLPLLRQLATDADWRVRKNVAEGLLPVERNLQLYHQLAADSDARVRQGVAEAIGIQLFRDAFLLLLEELARDEDEAVRQSAIYSLMASPNDRAAELVEELLADGDESVRSSAEWIAELHGETTGLPQTHVLSQSPDWRVTGTELCEKMARGEELSVSERKELVSALAEAPSVEAVPFLVDLTEDPDRGVRTDAAYALQLIGTADIVPVLEKLLRARLCSLNLTEFRRLAIKHKRYVEPIAEIGFWDGCYRVTAPGGKVTVQD